MIVSELKELLNYYRDDMEIRIADNEEICTDEDIYFGKVLQKEDLMIKYDCIHDIHYLKIGA